MSLPKISQDTYGPVDVLVAGGGLAGIAAAIAAARGGANTMLVEKAGWLGGMGVTGVRFATLMRVLCQKNGGTFVGLNTYRP